MYCKIYTAIFDIPSIYLQNTGWPDKNSKCGIAETIRPGDWRKNNMLLKWLKEGRGK